MAGKTFSPNIEQRMMTTPTRPPVHAKRIGPTLVPDRSRVLMRPFRPTTDDISRRIVARSWPCRTRKSPGCWPGARRVCEPARARGKFFRKRFTQVKFISNAGRRAVARTADAHRRLLHARVFAGVGGAVQSVHRAASRPVRAAQGRAAFHPEFARHGRRTHFLHHLPRRLRQRATCITLTPPVPFVTEPERVPNAAYDKGLFRTNFRNGRAK
jgi:hypothetical protein